MKKYFNLALMCLFCAGFFCACDKDEPQKPSVNYDQMIGEWTLTSYSVKWTNMDEGKVEKDFTYDSGFLNIEKKDDGSGDMYYYYRENFANESREEYYGRLEIDTKNNFIYLRAEDGFQRSDNAEIYDFTVSFPAEGKMEWTYSWQGSHGDLSVSHTCKREVKAVFSK